MPPAEPLLQGARRATARVLDLVAGAVQWLALPLALLLFLQWPLRRSRAVAVLLPWAVYVIVTGAPMDASRGAPAPKPERP